jgi:Bacterial capsule synthesis protein PGA_cap
MHAVRTSSSRNRRRLSLRLDLEPPVSSAQRHAKKSRIALAGDTMLWRGVARELESGRPPKPLVAPKLAELTRAADLFVLDLECCISERGAPVPKVLDFRTPPNAVETLLQGATA